MKIRINKIKNTIHFRLFITSIRLFESNNIYINQKTYHELMEKMVLKFLENAKILDLGRKHRGDIEVEVENGDKLKKLEEMTAVILYKEVVDVLRDYSEGRMTLDDAHVQLLPYVIAKKLIKT